MQIYWRNLWWLFERDLKFEVIKCGNLYLFCVCGISLRCPGDLRLDCGLLAVIDCSIENAWLVSWHHILDVDESILTTVHFEQFQGLLDQISKIVSFPLTIIDLVSQVVVSSFEQIHDWEDLSVVWHESFTNGFGTGHKSLQNFQGNRDNFWVSSVQSCLDWDDELRDDREYLSSTLLEHVKHTLDS